MATPKKKSTPKNPPAAAAQTADASLANEIKTKLDAFVARLTSQGIALTPVESQAFMSASSDADCATAGTRTRSDLVLSGALALITTAEQPLNRFPGNFPYSLKRYLFLITCAQDLAVKCSAQSTSTLGVGAARKTLANLVSSARAARIMLLAYLTPVARGNATITAAVDAQLGVDLRTPSALAAALKALAQIAQGCVTSHDPAMLARCAGANLTQAGVTAATNAAAALAQAESAAAGTQRAVDSPEVNTSEGRVLLEVRELVAAFKTAHTANPNISELIVPAGMRAGVGTRPTAATTKAKKKAVTAKAGAATPAATASAPATTTAAPATTAKSRAYHLKGRRATPKKKAAKAAG